MSLLEPTLVEHHQLLFRLLCIENKFLLMIIGLKVTQIARLVTLNISILFWLRRTKQMGIALKLFETIDLQMLWVPRKDGYMATIKREPMHVPPGGRVAQTVLDD